MEGFDILDKNQTILGNLLIEASAGTGKTFTIEHTVLRLIEEEKIPLHKILLLTFTNASQEDLMERVFARLKKRGFFGFLEEMPILTFQKFIARFNKKEEKIGKQTPLYLDIENQLRRLVPYKEFGPKQLLGHLFTQKFPDFSGELIRFDHAVEQIKRLLDRTWLEKTLPDFKGLKEEDHHLFELFFTDLPKGLDRQLTKKNWGWMKLTLENVRAKKTVFFPESLIKIQSLITQLRDEKMILALFAQTLTIDSYSREFDLFIEKIQDEAFVKNISERFEAVIVDEFQDTDPRQWQILETLFLYKPHVKTFMVVGDPKQSIYRFRNADYTSFFAAKEKLTPYQLTTAYRSSIHLTHAINYFFSVTQSPFYPIEYFPVIAGRKENGLDIPMSLVMFDEDSDLFSWILTLLQQKTVDVSSTAILVQHRYQATKLEQYLKAHHIPVKRIDKTPIKDRLCFQQFDTMLSLLKNRFDRRALATYHFITTQELVEEVPVTTIEKIAFVVDEAHRGNFLPFLKEFVTNPLFPWLTRAPITRVEDIEELYAEIFYSTEAVSEATAGVNGVELITTFSSKGLEYETVITLALATDAKKGEISNEDLEENMRLLYVAFTRPRERLIVPVVRGKKSTVNRFLEKLSREIDSPFIEVIAPLIATTKPEAVEFVAKASIEEVPPLYYPPKNGAISFSSLDLKDEVIEKATVTEKELPLGIDSGIFIHKIFEKIFSDQSRRITDEVVNSIVDKTLLFSRFKAYKEYILQKVHFVLNLQINGIALKDIHPHRRLAESPFAFDKFGQRFEGVLDLLLFFDDKLVILDYKLTHPRNLSVQQMMQTFHYDEQGKLYLEAIRSLFPGFAANVEMMFVFLRNEEIYVQH